MKNILVLEILESKTSFAQQQLNFLVFFYSIVCHWEVSVF